MWLNVKFNPSPPLTNAPRGAFPISFMAWTIQLTSASSRTFLSASFSHWASSVAFSSFLFFAAAGSEASQTISARWLYYILRGVSRNDAPKTHYVLILGTNNSVNNLDFWPWLADYESERTTATGIWWYWKKPYSFSNTPFYYSPGGTANFGTVPDDWTSDDVFAMNYQLNSFPNAEQAAIQGINCRTDVNGATTNHVFQFVKKKVGTINTDGSVVTYDSDGNVVCAYPDAYGYIQGYREAGPGVYDIQYYRVDSGQLIKLDSIESSNSQALTYDPDTGLYSFQQNDYTPYLADIRSGVNRLVDIGDNIRLEFPETVVNPEITFSPEITVNPEVTVTPDITVNPEITVTPDITVNVTSSPSGSLSVADITQAIDESLPGQATYDFYDIWGSGTYATELDLSDGTLSSEDQSLVDIVEGWQTQIPVISNACDFALGAAFGNVPTIPPSSNIPLTDIRVLGFNIVIDWTPYAEHFRWFRAFCLMLEVIWFVNSVWKTAIKAMQV